MRKDPVLLYVHRNVKRFRGGLVVKAHRWLYHSTLGSRVIKKKAPDVCQTTMACERTLSFWIRHMWSIVPCFEGVGWLNGLGGVPREQKMLKGHLPIVTYNKVY